MPVWLFVCLSVRPSAKNNSAATRWIFSNYLTSMADTLLEDFCTLMITSHRILLRKRNVSGKNCRRDQNEILCSVTFFRKFCSLWYNVKKYGTTRQATGENIIRCMRIARWITKAIDTHSEYVILISFPRQQWLHERASMLRSTFIACLVNLRYNVTSLICLLHWCNLPKKFRDL
jgi:hypothetical protein